MPSLPRKVTIVQVKDWEAVYFDDTQVHWHDALSAGRMLALLGIDFEYLDYDEEAISEDNMPLTLKGYKDAIREHDRKKLIHRRARLVAEVSLIDKELNGD